MSRKIKISKDKLHDLCIEVAHEYIEESHDSNAMFRASISATVLNRLENKLSKYMEDNKMKTVAKFKRVSYEQFIKDSALNDCAIAQSIYTDIRIPVRSTKGSAGYDFFAPREIVIQPHSEILIPTGIKCKIRKGYVLNLYPRSGLGFKYGLRLLNTVGIIDSDYYNNADNEGHIKVKMYNPTDRVVIVEENTAFVQGIFTKFYLAEEEEVTEERKGGFGSTTK